MNRVVFLRHLSPMGLGLGVLLWLLSLTPTLIARGWAVQGLTSGICLAAGYGIGSVVELALRRATRRSSAPLGRGATMAAAIGLLLVALVGMVAWTSWQNEARDLVGMSQVAWWEGVPMVLASVAVAVALGALARKLGSGLRSLHRRTGSHQPGPLGIGVTGAIVGILAVVGLGLGLRGLHGRHERRLRGPRHRDEPRDRSKHAGDSVRRPRVAGRVGHHGPLGS